MCCVVLSLLRLYGQAIRVLRYELILLARKVSKKSIKWLFQFSSVAQLLLTLSNPMDWSMQDLPVHQQLLKLAQTHVHWVSDVIEPSHPLLPLLLPSIVPSIRAFSNDPDFCLRWPKCWSFSVSINPSNEYSGLISFRIIWLDLLAVQGILKSLLQHHSSKVSILWCLAFFMVQLSYPYMTTGKTIALIRQIFVGKVK